MRIGKDLSKYLTIANKKNIDKLYTKLASTTSNTILSTYNAGKNLNRVVKNTIKNQTTKTKAIVKDVSKRTIQDIASRVKEIDPNLLNINAKLKALINKKIAFNNKLDKENQKLYASVIQAHLSDVKNIQVLEHYEKLLEKSGEKEKKLIQKRLEQEKKRRNIPNISSAQYKAYLSMGTEDTKKALLQKKELYSSANEETKKALAIEILDLINKKDILEGEKTKGKETKPSDKAINTSFSRKEYNKFVKDYNVFKSYSIKKFSELDDEIEDIKFQTGLIKKTLDQVKYTENDGIKANLLQKMQAQLGGMKTLKLLSKGLLPFLAAKETYETIAESEAVTDFVTDFEMLGSDAGLMDKANLTVMTKALMGKKGSNLDYHAATNIAKEIISNTPKKDVAKVFSAALAMSNGNPNLVSGKKVGLLQIDSSDPEVVAIIKEMYPASTSEASIQERLKDPKTNIQIFNAIRKIKKQSVEKIVSTLPQNQQVQFKKELDINKAEVLSAAKQISINETTGKGSRGPIAFGSSRLYKIQAGVDMEHLQPYFLNNFNRMIIWFRSIPGNENAEIVITSAYRSQAEQTKMYKAHKAGKNYGTGVVAKNSVHSLGLAIDANINGKPIGTVIDSSTMKKFKLRSGYRGVIKGDSQYIHVESIDAPSPEKRAIAIKQYENALMASKLDTVKKEYEEYSKDSSQLDLKTGSRTKEGAVVTGAAAGGIAGTILGTPFGPVGMMAGGAIGTSIGAGIGNAGSRINEVIFEESTEDIVKRIVKPETPAPNKPKVSSEKVKVQPSSVNVQKPKQNAKQPEQLPPVLPNETQRTQIPSAPPPKGETNTKNIINNQNKGI